VFDFTDRNGGQFADSCVQICHHLHHHYHHHHLAVTEFGHLLGRTGLNRPKVSLKVFLGPLTHEVYNFLIVLKDSIPAFCQHVELNYTYI
jgi:hypothetical protein